MIEIFLPTCQSLQRMSENSNSELKSSPDGWVDRPTDFDAGLWRLLPFTSKCHCICSIEIVDGMQRSIVWKEAAVDTGGSSHQEQKGHRT